MRNVTRGIMLVVAASLIASGATSARADDRGHHRAAAQVHRHSYVVRYAPAYPRWLRAHRDFHRWYMQGHYRYGARLDWQRLFKLYQNDRHYHRNLRLRNHHGRHDRRRH